MTHQLYYLHLNERRIFVVKAAASRYSLLPTPPVPHAAFCRDHLPMFRKKHALVTAAVFALAAVFPIHSGRYIGLQKVAAAAAFVEEFGVVDIAFALAVAVVGVVLVADYTRTMASAAVEW